MNADTAAERSTITPTFSVDRGDRFLHVLSSRPPKASCAKCYGRGYTGTIVKRSGRPADEGLLQPCRCIGAVLKHWYEAKVGA